MHLDPMLLPAAVLVSAMLTTGVLMRKLRQPFVVGALVTGLLLGPAVLGVLDDVDAIGRLGAVGVVLLLFFVGMEASPRRLLGAWRIALIGTLAQILVSVACAGLVGWALDWPLSRSLLIGFVISLSSTAVVMRLLQRSGDSDSPVGESVVAVLLAQDVAIVPMMLTVAFLGGGAEAGAGELALQGVGAAALAGLLLWMIRRGEVPLPLGRWFGDDHELMVFGSLLPCLLLALATGLMGLSTGLGAFVGGMLISMTPDVRRVTDALKPFEVVFVGLFFVSVGMLLDLSFLTANWALVLVIVALVLLTNTGINSVILRVSGQRWRDALYGGALLSQVGEFSFVLAAAGKASGLIGEYAYQTTVATIILSLAVSPAWVALFRRMARR